MMMPMKRSLLVEILNTFKINSLLSMTEIDAKRGLPVHTLTPTPRRRSDPDFLKWDSEVNAILDDDYEG